MELPRLPKPLLSQKVPTDPPRTYVGSKDTSLPGL